MLNILKKLFNESENKSVETVSDLHLFCGLMIEAANIDGIVDQTEIEKISKVLVEVFHENPELVEIEIHNCLKELNDNKSLHFFTSRINKSFAEEKKLLLIETLWEIIMADKKIHDYESNLIRRLSGLLYISDRDCGNAKKKVLTQT